MVTWVIHNHCTYTIILRIWCEHRMEEASFIWTLTKELICSVRMDLNRHFLATGEKHLPLHAYLATDSISMADQKLYELCDAIKMFIAILGQLSEHVLLATPLKSVTMLKVRQDGAKIEDTRNISMCFVSF